MRHKDFLTAFAEGKNVEYRGLNKCNEKWSRVTEGTSVGAFNSAYLEFRIAPRIIKVERWVNLRETADGRIDERTFSKEHNARDDAQFLRKDGQKVLAEAVHLCTEVEVAE